MEVKVIPTELAAGGVQNATATWEEYMNYRQTNKQTEARTTGQGKILQALSLVSCALALRQLPWSVTPNIQGLVGGPVRTGGRQGTVKLWRQLKVSGAQVP